VTYRNPFVYQIQYETRQAVEAAGGKFDQDVFARALRKAKRWMVAAYGSQDYEAYIAESGASIAFFYAETLAEPAGKRTFNRGRSA